MLQMNPPKKFQNKLSQIFKQHYLVCGFQIYFSANEAAKEIITISSGSSEAGSPVKKHKPPS